MSALQNILTTFRHAAVTEREKGTYFEELIIQYLRHEASYQDLYSQVWTYAEWADLQQLDKRDTGIDLVAQTRGTNEFHAIQCKFYAEKHKVQKRDIDSFFTASGKTPFTHRVIVSTALHWTEHAEDALRGQQPPVSKIDLNDLENSQIDWSRYQPHASPVLKAKKQLRPHQETAVQKVQQGLATADRGKLIMACGTGKTFTSLKIAESLVGKGGRVLFLVPSLALLSQTLTEWTQESTTPLHSFAVCSDADVGKKRKQDDDAVQVFTHELRYPATTNAARLAAEMQKRHDAHHLSVVFSTYHSIDVIHAAQQQGLAAFDLIICDEAHRTTGATFSDESESNFVKVHNNLCIQAAKRLYMTATPRIYGEDAKKKSEDGSVTLCSMDDVTLFGEELHVINFSEAVKRGLLVDYKVIVLAVEETHVSRRLQTLLRDENNQLKVDDAAKIVGCWKALSKQDTREDLITDPDPMRRAVAFCQVIEYNQGARVHKVSSKQIAGMFREVIEAYKDSETDTSQQGIAHQLQCEAMHVDGSMNASEKEASIQWLKAETPENTCRILSNVRCLSEGVDVPALDAVLFLTPRGSQVDVVQSVGRVMRNAPNKQRGYVILPVVIPAGVEPHEALNDNKTYKVVWEVLQALRSHDDRFDAMINKMDLELNTKMLEKMEVIAVTDKVNKKTKQKAGEKRKTGLGRGSSTIGKPHDPRKQQMEMEFEIGELERAIYAKIVQKCGNRQHWADWAVDIARIARTHIDRIQGILENRANVTEIAAFNAFAEELRDDLNNAITNEEVIEMLAQHLITKPVFDALFEGYSFTEHNPMSKAMQGVLEVLQEHRLDKETDTLERFYESVKMRASNIDSAAGKQKIVVELYDKFFRHAFPKMTERLGIVYTPVEVVDFIIHSVNDVLQNEFQQTLGSENVHILDPFTGTGTFITRLLQSGLISPEQLAYKYQNEIHANEIVLLAYYIAAINIESVYHDLMQAQASETPYTPFNGICLTDTFQLHEKEDLVDKILDVNSERRKRQKALDIRVIIGNPPYSAGQESANDNNANIAYPTLDERIRSTYAAHSRAANKQNLYDSYIRAIRWASDRIKDAGIIGFVSGNGFIEKPAMDGMRKCLADDFSSLYVFNLRGDIRKNMLSKGRAMEGQNVFGSGSMTGISITLFIKNPSAGKKGNIYYFDVGNNLKQSEKLEKITKFKSINGISDEDIWVNIKPDQHNDWIGQRDNSSNDFINIGDKKEKKSNTIFSNFSLGLASARDAWVYNYSKKKLAVNMGRTIDFYNSEVRRYQLTSKNSDADISINNFVNTDPQKISWADDIKRSLQRGKTHNFSQGKLVPALYRPFARMWLYYDKEFNQRRYQMPHIFPDSSIDNKVICVSGIGARSGFSVLISNMLPNLHTIDTGQCFPLKLYEHASEEENDALTEQPQGDLFSQSAAEPAVEQPRYTIKDGISDAGLAHFQAAYPNETLSKEDLFYYIYGLLHSEDYKTRYADNLTKELPRIPAVKQAADFWAFSKAGRELAELHIHYETQEKYPVTLDCGKQTLAALQDKDFYVTKMKFAKKGDKSTVIYNHAITMRAIPLAAYDYVVNGKPALEWVMERQAVTTHKDSGIVNDANDWAIETMGNARYPLELFQRVITVSLRTMEIVKSLPALAI